MLESDLRSESSMLLILVFTANVQYHYVVLMTEMSFLIIVLLYVRVKMFLRRTNKIDASKVVGYVSARLW